MQLIRPDPAFRSSFLAALAEFQSEGRYPHLDAAALAADFDGFVEALRAGRLPTPRFPPADLPETVLWLVEDETFFGRVTIRHELDEWRLTHAGHIGYDLRPTARGRGLGHLALRLALDHARDVIGLDRVLLICNPTNTASERVIRAAGGVFAGQFVFDDWPRPLRHFWVELGEKEKPS